MTKKKAREERRRRRRWRRVTTNRCVFLTLVVLVAASLLISPWSSNTTTADVELRMDQPMRYNFHNSTQYLYNDVLGPDKNKHCHRPCDPSIRNRIVYTCLHPAGFLDRQELLDNLLELAAFLCATLEFPTPAASFHPMHNHQLQADKSLNWSDFFDYKYSFVDGSAWNTISTSSHIPPISMLQSVHVKMDASFYIPLTTKPHCRRPRAAPDRNRETYGLHIISKSRDEVIGDFDILRKYSFQGNSNKQEHLQLPFLWEIPTNFYAFHKEFRQYIRALPPENSKGSHMGSACLPWSRSGRYVQRTLPAKVQSLVDDVWTAVVATNEHSSSSNRRNNNYDLHTTSSTSTASPQSSLVGFLHIRRGDTIDECDTSISKLRGYLSCSLANMTFPTLDSRQDSQSLAAAIFDSNAHPHSIRMRYITLLLGTNEENPSYMRDLKKMVELLAVVAQWNGQDVHLKVRAVDMESLIWDFLQSRVLDGEIPASYLNNLYVFQIEEHIMNHRVDFKLAQRRHRYCNDCDKIVIKRRITVY